MIETRNLTRRELLTGAGLAAYLTGSVRSIYDFDLAMLLATSWMTWSVESGSFSSVVPAQTSVSDFRS